MRLIYNHTTAVIQTDTQTHTQILEFVRAHEWQDWHAYQLLMIAGMDWREADMFMLHTKGFRMEASEELDAGPR